MTESNSPDVQKPSPPIEEATPLVTPSTSMKSKSGPPSPVSVLGRKRRSRDVDLDELDDRKSHRRSRDVDLDDLDDRKSSLRGANNASGSGAGVKNTRFKRPKTASAN